MRNVSDRSSTEDQNTHFIVMDVKFELKFFICVYIRV